LLLLVYGIATFRRPLAFSFLLVGTALLSSSGRYQRPVSITIVRFAAVFLAIAVNWIPAWASDVKDIVVALVWTAVLLLVFARWVFKRY